MAYDDVDCGGGPTESGSMHTQIMHSLSCARVLYGLHIARSEYGMIEVEDDALAYITAVRPLKQFLETIRVLEENSYIRSIEDTPMPTLVPPLSYSLTETGKIGANFIILMNSENSLEYRLKALPDNWPEELRKLVRLLTDDYRRMFDDVDSRAERVFGKTG